MEINTGEIITQLVHLQGINIWRAVLIVNTEQTFWLWLFSIGNCNPLASIVHAEFMTYKRSVNFLLFDDKKMRR